MKYAFILLFLPVFAFSQSDSLANTLQRYKSMYEQGLIDSSEYKALKAKAAGINQPTQQIPSVVTIVKAPNPTGKYKAKITTGGVFLGVGVAFLIGDFGYLIGTNLKKPTPTNRKETLIGLGVISGAHIIIGAALVGVGQHQRAVYESKKAALNIQLNNNTVGLALNF